ncbi:uncharacterized protein LOC111712961 [Eurytemora carolleeae]|uniref:uncharacterized protein LOC111712961 n=1 Tax=Eurytemora carolleeae TaxID=1294199 RepID=UPI000C773992|nr:uncharacterized protein LOC111712961 [Eurytemora carolleeae]|eukprot:XP_023343492.1 uncharacterized protein LOC111712961 [Eurytemora affinis]
MLCSVHGLIKDLVETLKVHQRLQKSSAEYLLKLIEHLGQHSLSAGELKLLIRFLITQDEDDEEEEAVQFPYKSHIIHILSSMAKGKYFVPECKSNSYSCVSLPI